MSIKKITSLASYINEVNEVVSSLRTKNDISKIWFRGESSTKWLTPLMPKAYRLPYNDPDCNEAYKYVQNTEGNKIAEFKRLASISLNEKLIKSTSWNYYYLMQHYGMRTRLLDWTESALIALFFAISDKTDSDSLVWILDAFELNRNTIKECTNNAFESVSCVYMPNDCRKLPLINDNGKFNLDEMYRRYLDMDFPHNENQISGNYYPLAIYPTLLDERMSSQQSCFTIFGNKINGLLTANLKDKFLSKIIIDQNSRVDILQELKKCGITFRSIYPDLEGICKSIDENTYWHEEFSILKKIE